MGTLSPEHDDPGIAALLGWLRGWLPAGCGVAAILITDRLPGEFAEEERLVARSVARRRNEFRAGRAAARAALAQAGGAPGAILASPQRDPIWPPGFLGSISHSDRLALAIAAPRSLIHAMGIDLEDDPRLDPQLVATVCRTDERDQAPGLARVGIDHAKLCFVAKEAVFKAIFPLRRIALEFDQLRVSFHIPEHSFSVALRESAQAPFSQVAGSGRFLCDSRWLAAAFLVPRPPASVNG